ncbi:small acid-soluble spore protein [Clostridia bacterium]|nr:small acid-soluble spore protein [Clostridia bacterium]
MPKTTSNSKESMEQIKNQAASEVGVNLKDGANLSAREAGSVGGQMVKKMVDAYKNQ